MDLISNCVLDTSHVIDLTSKPLIERVDFNSTRDSMPRIPSEVAPKEGVVTNVASPLSYNFDAFYIVRSFRIF